MKCIILSLFITITLSAQSLLWWTDDVSFSPTDVTSATLMGWYDFSDASTRTDSSGTIAAISDKSSYNNDISQGFNASRPLVATGQNSLEVADFANKYLYTNSLTGFSATSDGVTIFVVCKFDLVSGRSIMEASDNTSSNRGFSFFNEANVNYFRPDGANSASYSFTNTATYVILSAVHSPSSRTIYENGTPKDTNNTTQNMTAVPTRIRFGTLINGTTYPFDGQIGEILIYKGAISSDEQTKIEKYLNDKWTIY